MIIGVDPHKRSHTATAVDAVTNARVASLQVDASLAGYRHLLRVMAIIERIPAPNPAGPPGWLVRRRFSVVLDRTSSTTPQFRPDRASY